LIITTHFTHFLKNTKHVGGLMVKSSTVSVDIEMKGQQPSYMLCYDLICFQNLYFKIIVYLMAGEEKKKHIILFHLN